MSVLETNTIDGVTYDLHDKLVGSGTLQTTAQTLIPAVNELKSGLTTVGGKTNIIGSGALDTTSQTLIGAVNELKTALAQVKTKVAGSKTVPSFSGSSLLANDGSAQVLFELSVQAGNILVFHCKRSQSSCYVGYGFPKNTMDSNSRITIYSTFSDGYSTTSDNYSWSILGRGGFILCYFVEAATLRFIAGYEYASTTVNYQYMLI